ncbi:MAG: MFS transporter [Actinomycetia bacterium]|nr:MFS transporter [Actinomycetes bacterium]
MTDAAREGQDSSLGRRFWRLWTAFTAANLADGLTLVAFPLLAIGLTDDARQIALVTVFRFIPFVLVGLPAGVLLDRYDRRLIAMLAQVGRAATAGLLAAIVLADRASIPLVVAAAFVIGVGEVLTDGGLPALVRDLVRPDQLEVANSRFSATQTVSNVFIGPPLGALLFEIETSAPFAASLLLFVVATGVLARIPGSFRASPEAGIGSVVGPRQDAEGERGGLRRLIDEVSVGLRYVWGHQILRPLAFTVLAFSFAGQATNAVFVILVTERFGLGGLGFGALIAVRGTTSLAMSFGVARFIRRAGHGMSMRFAVVAFTAASLLFGLATAAILAVVASLINGLSDPAWNVVSSTVRQRLVPDEVFGRMMTAYLFIAWSMNPVGALVGGIIAERWGAEWVWVMAAAVVGSLLVLGKGLFRAIDEAMALDPSD